MTGGTGPAEDDCCFPLSVRLTCRALLTHAQWSQPVHDAGVCCHLVTAQGKIDQSLKLYQTRCHVLCFLYTSFFIRTTGSGIYHTELCRWRHISCLHNGLTSVEGKFLRAAAHPESYWHSSSASLSPYSCITPDWANLPVDTQSSTLSVCQPASSRPVSWPVCDGLCLQANLILMCSKCKTNLPTLPLASLLDRLLYYNLIARKTIGLSIVYHLSIRDHSVIRLATARSLPTRRNSSGCSSASDRDQQCAFQGWIRGT